MSWLILSGNTLAESVMAAEVVVQTHNATATAVLQGEVLERVGSFLDAQSLVSATATNSAFQQSLTSSRAWEHATWLVPFKLMLSAPHHIVWPSMTKLQHLVLPISVMQSGVYKRSAKRFLQHIPAMPMLKSLHNVHDANVSDLENKFPQLQSLSLIHTNMTPAMWTLLQQMSHLQILRLIGDSKFAVSDLKAALPRLRANGVEVHMEVISSAYDLPIHDLIEFLEVAHHLHSLTVRLNVFAIEHIVEEHDEELAYPPADSALQSLRLTMFCDDEWFAPEEMEEDELFFQPMYQASVLALLRYFYALTEVRIVDTLEGSYSDDDVEEYCASHGITLDVRQRGYMEI